MAKQLIPLVKSGYLASPGYIPLVHGNGLTTNVEPEPEYETLTGDIVTFNSLRVQPLEALSCAITPVQSGSGTPAPDNVRPITGWSEAKVTRTGANVWDEEWEAGAIDSATGGNAVTAQRIRSKNYISIRPETSYYGYFDTSKYSSGRIAYYDANKTYLGQSAGWKTLNSNLAFTTVANAYYMRFVFVQTDATYSGGISFNYPSTDHSYHAYSGQTLTIDLSGTRYGGTLDVLTGVLTVTHLSQNMGDLSWSRSGSWLGAPALYSAGLTSVIVKPSPSVAANGWCACYPVVARTAVDNNPDIKALVINNDGLVVVRDSSYSDAATFKTAMSGMTLVYELATPLSVQLTAAELETILGQNNVWASTGQTTLTYQTN